MRANLGAVKNVKNVKNYWNDKLEKRSFKVLNLNRGIPIIKRAYDTRSAPSL